MSHEEDSSFLRQSPWRYLGYLNEVGESFRPLIPSKVVLSTYIISGGYVFTDSLLIGLKSYNAEKDNSVSYERKKRFATSFAKCFIWQILATELIPGFLVYWIVRITKRNYLLQILKNRSLALWLPTFLGLSFIPIFPYTIDPLVDKLFMHMGITLETSQIKI